MRRTKFSREQLLCDGILRLAIRQNKEKRNSASWLINSRDFDPSLRIADEKRQEIEALFDLLINDKNLYKREVKLRDFETLLANVLKQKKHPVRISIHRNAYIENQIISYYILKLIDMLHENGLIEVKKGFQNKNESFDTRIYATHLLMEYCPEFPRFIYSEPGPLVVLRDSKGKSIPFKDTIETWRIKTILKRVNEINGLADIRYQGCKINAHLTAIFSQKLTLYGRLHTKGYSHYQGLTGDERSEITINGVPVVELDYSGLHPYLLYASVGIQYKGDPYSVINNDSSLRSVFKHILLCMLNSKSITHAELGVKGWLDKNPDEREILRELKIFAIRPLINDFIEAHKPIEKYFFTGKMTGLRIMNKDSKIALDIINHFGKQDIPILPVHDSFIVQEQYRDELYKTMMEKYKKHTGGFDIKIK